jgi:hypothetical protein
VESAEQVRLHRFTPGGGIGVSQRADGSQHPCCADQYAWRAELDGHALHGSRHLVVISNVGSQSHGDAAAVLDFKMGQIELGFRSGQQSDAGSCLGKTQSEPLPDASTGAGDEYAFVFQATHRITVLYKWYQAHRYSEALTGSFARGGASASFS